MKWVKWCVVVVVGIFVVLVAAEISLRFAGQEPLPAHDQETTATLLEPDPVLGWKNREGTYEYPPFGIPAHILKGGVRDTGAGMIDDRKKVVVLGCSFTAGWMIADSDTYCWKLQEKFPSVQILNYAVPGYNTYQCLLALERYLDSAPPPVLVLYGFINHHEIRTVAAPEWFMLLGLVSHWGAVSVPYCTLDAHGDLEKHPPLGYAFWPLADRLALLACLQRKFEYRVRASLGDVPAAEQQAIIVQKLMLEMNQRCQAKGAAFRVVFLCGNANAYTSFLQEHGVRFLDCGSVYDSSLTTSVDPTHPGPEMNTRWAGIIAPAISDELAVSGSSSSAR
jgi:hypothetical protein